MDLYSIALAIGLVSAPGSLLLLLASLLSGPSTSVATRRLAGRAVGLAGLSLALAWGVHIAFGHRPGSAEALGPVAFVREHPALVAVSLLTLVTSLLLRVVSTPRSDTTR